jgi:hypothetical protein
MLSPGTTIAGYRVDGIVGQGGMGVVYEATQISLQRTIALKLLAAELSEDPSFRERFRREGLLQAALDHPHIIPVYEAGESPHGLFLAMRLVRGPDLKRMLRRGALDERRALRILGQVADALDTAHEAGLTHRDIKPQNVLVAGRDHAYLADFGLTKAPGGDSLTTSGQFVGTVNYTAPEVIRGEGSSAASDVYAMGAVLYECLSGQVPFPRESEAAVIYAHLQDPPPRPSAAHPGLPSEVDTVVGRAMSKDPAARQPTASELAEEAARALGLEGVTPVREPGSSGRRRLPRAEPSEPEGPQTGVTRTLPPRREGTRVPAWALALMALAALGVLAGAFVAGRAAAPDDAPATRTLSSPRVAVDVPAAWRDAPQARVPGLRLNDQLAAAPAAPAGAALIAGHVRARNATLLPGALLARLPSRPAAPMHVKLGDYQALRYDRLRPRGLNGSATVYAVPTSFGVATIACVAPTGAAPRALAGCHKAATSLRLRAGRPFPVAPRVAYARALTTAMTQVNDVRGRSRDRLRFASDASLQAIAAEDLAGGYKSARRTLAAQRVSPQEAAAHAALLGSLTGARGAYVRLATAARAGDAAGYESARTEVGRAESLVTSSLRGLQPLGYRTG